MNFIVAPRELRKLRIILSLGSEERKRGFGGGSESFYGNFYLPLRSNVVGPENRMYDVTYFIHLN